MGKICCACKTEVALTGFSPDSRASDGLQSKCRPCCGIAKKAKYAAEPEKARARQVAYYHDNREIVSAINAKSRAKNAEKIKAHKKEQYLKVKDSAEFIARRDAYTIASKEKKREYDREYRKANFKKVLQRAKDWRAQNPEKRKAIIKAYSARRRQQESGGDSTAALLAWEQSSAKVCYWCNCKCPKNYHVDHYVPLSRGGKHTVGNVVIACPKCNLTKNAKDPYVFAQSVGRLF